MGMNVVTFTADGTWIAPPTVSFAILEGCGGGGGGGAGAGQAATSTSNNTYSSGGGGGGGALRMTAIVPIIGGSTYTIDIGAGGAGGSSPSAFGSDGADTTFFLSATELARFYGAGFGYGGNSLTSTTDAFFVAGGPPVKHVEASYMNSYGVNDSSDVAGDGTFQWVILSPAFPSIFLYRPLAAGGHGCVNYDNNAVNYGLGAKNPHGFDGGSYGPLNGSDDSVRRGGGRGGGGGGGAYGAGGRGGSGAAASFIGTGNDGEYGVAAAANTGGGGGGGGAGGCGGTLSGNGGNGGAGGSGLLKIIFFT